MGDCRLEMLDGMDDFWRMRAWLDILAASDRDRIALGVIFIDSLRITSPKPGSSTRINARTASGVTSR